MFGAPPVPAMFPATDRPSSAFIERMTRTLRSMPDDVLGPTFSLTSNGCHEDIFETCLSSLGPTSHYAVVSVAGVYGLIGIPDAVLQSMVEFAYGGNGSEATFVIATPSRLSVRYGYRFATMFADAAASALSVAGMTVIGATDVPAEAVSMKARAVGCGFDVVAGDVPLGTIALFLPMLALAQIETTAVGPSSHDHWRARLEHAIGGARVTVRCVLARPTLSAGEVARLVPGAVIPIPTLNEVALIAAGFRIATGVADARDGRAAIMINRTEFH